MKAKLTRFLLIGTAAVAVLATACQRLRGDDILPTPVELADASAGDNRSLAVPTATRIVIGPTFTPIATVTLLPSPTPPATKPPVYQRLEDFGDNRNPLTGLTVDDPAVLQRRPIAVKISNSPASYVRPQSGLGQADLVFEHVTEGPITRFTAIIYGQTPPNMGPIRSARLIDLQIPVMYDAALAYSGSSIGVSRLLFGSDIRPRILRTNQPGYYRTGEDKPYEHTLYGKPDGFWQALTDRGENRQPVFANTMAFGIDVPAGGVPADSVQIKYKDWTTIDWHFDAQDGRYLRTVDGEMHVDANDGAQLSAANVVLIFAPHHLNNTICEYQSGNRCLAFSTDIPLLGQGQALVFRDGQQYSAFWRRSSDREMITLATGTGEPVPLQLGNTWFQVIPLDYPDPYSTG